MIPCHEYVSMPRMTPTIFIARVFKLYNSVYQTRRHETFLIMLQNNSTKATIYHERFSCDFNFKPSLPAENRGTDTAISVCKSKYVITLE